MAQAFKVTFNARIPTLIGTAGPAGVRLVLTSREDLYVGGADVDWDDVGGVVVNGFPTSNFEVSYTTLSVTKVPVAIDLGPCESLYGINTDASGSFVQDVLVLNGSLA